MTSFAVHAVTKTGEKTKIVVDAFTPSQASATAKMLAAQRGEHIQLITKVKVDKS